MKRSNFNREENGVDLKAAKDAIEFLADEQLSA